MDLELHQVELRYAAMRIDNATRHARLIASLLRYGQQTPVFVIAGDADNYVLIDGYARIGALRKLGRDVVSAILLDMPEPDALVFTFRLGVKQHHGALEQGWLIAELVQRHGWTHREIGHRLHRSASWVCRRLALVHALPSSVQDAIRDGVVPPQAAMKTLVPLARANTQHCESLVRGLGKEPTSVRELERLYYGWKQADEETRERIVTQPRLYLAAEAATHAVPEVPEGDPAAPLLNDLDGIVGIARRARRRIRDGVLRELDTSRLNLVDRSSQEVRLCIEGLTTVLEQKKCSTSTPAPPS